MREITSRAQKRARTAKRGGGDAAVPAVPLLELRSVGSLVPYARNAKKHSDAHVREIAASIIEFGWTNPILADDVIRAGHGRQKAAQLLYKQGQTIRLPNGQALPAGMVPVIDCT